MKFFKQLGLVVAGGVIGAGLTLAVAPARAAQPSGRLTALDAGAVGGAEGYFVRDEKSGGCWFVMSSSASGITPQVSVATAPEAACSK